MRTPIAGAQDLYSHLMAHAPAGEDAAFDAHVLASILAVATSDGLSVPEGCGLARGELRPLLDRHFVGVDAERVCLGRERELDEEAAMVRDLLLGHRSADDALGRGLATMIARRAMEPNHLWEDLGLNARGELTRLLTRHFAPLAARNTRNMRWKRFFYRSLCESDGFVLCTTPVCAQCSDFDLCFGEETGEARMAERRRDNARAAAA